MIRTVLAEDNLLVREGEMRVIERLPDIELVDVCHDLPSLMAAVERENPDLVITDIRMPPTHSDEGVRAAEWLRECHPRIAVVVLSQYREPDYALRLLDGGSQLRGYLLKETLGEPLQLAAAVREVARGGSVVDPLVVDALVASRLAQTHSPLEALTERERSVLALMAQGKNNEGIAATLFMSLRVVEKQINSIFSKLQLGEEPDVHRRVKAVLLYLAEGMS
jgi:DNA-binding NarL/FixJ family response regulator